MINCPYHLIIEGEKYTEQFCQLKESCYFNCSDCSYRKYKEKRESIPEKIQDDY